MSTPSATLTVWAGSWLAGRSAPDDVLDALRAWAPRQSVAAGDPVTGGHTGLPWAADEDAEYSPGAGIMVLLKLIREAVRAPGSQVRLVLPVPGDVRGLPVGTEFAAAATEAGEGLLIGAPGGDGTGLVPVWPDDDTLQWRVYATPIPVTLEPEMPLGEAEFTMREAVRDAADALQQLHTTALDSSGPSPRDLIEDELEASSKHTYPDSMPLRARRILDTADQVAAILTVAERTPASAPTSATSLAARETLLRPLWNAIRAARLAAVHAAARQ
ncbi:hypothetical protein [Nocardia huaxiensis]|uniref:Uncharacterized protein n=1 Tax=Nocardia huaxiensis TaxID=2755382 RepID=A0A7D6ZEX3_9NOCA|nr:hypothetical protein [Nocardia huaxiensis]QLY28627.1 hypothetical protein H0264_25220 [Nocardia huaxiensis]UFS97902.1 hypothetical protein LPY97_08375 [Nocardia huaxiensis]